jgi:DNA repair protein RadD
MQLRWYQQEAVDAFFDYFAQGGRGNPLIALPTGTGKSVVIGETIRRAMTMYPGQRFIQSVHVKELVKQNSQKLRQLWPNAPIGINCSGLKQRDTEQAALFVSINSISRSSGKIGRRDLMFVDEAHLMGSSDTAMYNRVIKAMTELNPYFKVVGYTATAWRTKDGDLTDGSIFTDLVYNLCTVEGFNRLLSEGYLAPIFPRPTDAKIDLSGVGTRMGEFAANQLQEAALDPSVTERALNEMCQIGWDRRAWLCFASGVEHAEDIAERLRLRDIPSQAVHGKTRNRDEVIAAFKRGELRCLVNNNVLTTGFDFPPIDLIGMFRPTMSPGLWVQMLGRGTRPWAGGYIHDGLDPGTETYWPERQNCLVLDFARNTERLGPINDPVTPKKKKDKVPGDAPVKICGKCGTYNAAQSRTCDFCGDVFPINMSGPQIEASASTQDLIRADEESPIVETFQVQQVIYSKHKKRGTVSNFSMKCTYYCGLRRFTEYVKFGANGLPGHRANEWWRQRNADEPPADVDEALARQATLRAPRQIRVWVNKQYPEVMAHEY